RVGVGVHGGLALRKDGRGLIPVVVLRARRAILAEETAVEIERLHAVLVVEHRLAVGAEPGATHRVQVGGERRGGGGPLAARHDAITWLALVGHGLPLHPPSPPPPPPPTCC